MNEFSHGILRAFNVTGTSGAGGNTYCNIRPPEGEIWKIIAATVLHDDAALTMNIGWTDITGSLILPLYIEAAVGAGGALVQLFDKLKVSGQTWAHYQCYPYVYFAGMAAAKTITVRLVAEVVKGVPTMNDA